MRENSGVRTFSVSTERGPGTVSKMAALEDYRYFSPSN
jgi:hypothetical protein